MLVELIHQRSDFLHREVRPAGKVDHDAVAVRQHLPIPHQRAFQRTRERLVRAVRTVTLAIAEDAARMRTAQRGREFVEPRRDDPAAPH